MRWTIFFSFLYLIVHPVMWAQDIQNNRGGEKESDVIIGEIRYIDSIYYIHNPRISLRFWDRRNAAFADVAECYFYSDSLFFPKKTSKQKFADNLFNGHSFYFAKAVSFIQRVICPHISDRTLYPDTALYLRIDSAVVGVERRFDDRINEKGQKYTVVLFNTHCFLSVKVKALTFTKEINKIYNPPHYFFTKYNWRQAMIYKRRNPYKIKRDNPYLTILIPLEEKNHYSY